MEAEDLLSGYRVKYPRLIKYLGGCKVLDFIQTFRCSFLVGQELYQGDLTKQSAAVNNATFHFRPSQAPPLPSASEDEPAAITRAIYYLLFTKNQLGASNNIELGREAGNDIVVVDYSISKRHASFKLSGKDCIVTDRDSTNGTKLNGEGIPHGTNHVVSSGDVIELGRFGFMLMCPIDLFVNFRVQMGLEHTLRKELDECLRVNDSVNFRAIAANHDVDFDGKRNSVLLEELLEKISAREFLREIF